MQTAIQPNFSITYLTTDELSARIKYDSRTIRDRLKDSVLIEGRHYIRPFGGRKTLYIWEHVEADMMLASVGGSNAIPMANGGLLKVETAGAAPREQAIHLANKTIRHVDVTTQVRFDRAIPMANGGMLHG